DRRRSSTEPSRLTSTLPATAAVGGAARETFMSPVDEILSQIPMQQLAGQLGVDVETAAQAARTALPALLGGIQANTADPGGASSFAKAVEQHDPSLVEGGVDLNQ